MPSAAAAAAPGSGELKPNGMEKRSGNAGWLSDTLVTVMIHWDWMAATRVKDPLAWEAWIDAASLMHSDLLDILDGVRLEPTGKWRDKLSGKKQPVRNVFAYLESCLDTIRQDMDSWNAAEEKDWYSRLPKAVTALARAGRFRRNGVDYEFRDSRDYTPCWWDVAAGVPLYGVIAERDAEGNLVPLTKTLVKKRHPVGEKPVFEIVGTAPMRTDLAVGLDLPFPEDLADGASLDDYPRDLPAVNKPEPEIILPVSVHTVDMPPGWHAAHKELAEAREAILRYMEEHPVSEAKAPAPAKS